METITIKDIQLRLINRTDVNTNEYKPLDREPIIIKETDGTMSIVIGDGVNLIKDLKTSTSADLSKYTLLTDFNAHKNDTTSNPHSVTKAQVGLGNVDNTSDVDKPISTLQKAALDNKIDLLGNAPDGGPYRLTYFFEQIPGSDKITVKAHTISLDNKKTVAPYTLDVLAATSTTAGLMSASDKTALDNMGTNFQTKANLTTEIKANLIDTSDIKYPSEKASRKALDEKINLLGNETSSGIPYNFPYNFNTPVYTANNLSCVFDTITLDNKKSINHYTITLNGATSTTAGLMSAADKALLDNFGTTYQVKSNLTQTIDEDITKTNPQKYPSEKAVRTELDKHVELLGKEAVSGEEYHFPYHLAINVNENDFKVKAYTITLDNNKTLKTYDFALPLATDTTAGLMSKDDKYTLNHLGTTFQLVANLDKTMPSAATGYSETRYLSTKATKEALDDKVSLLGNEEVSGEPYHFTYYYSLDQKEDSIDVTAYTITLDNKKSLSQYTLTIPSATHDKAGLMSSFDKTKLDNLDASKYELIENKLTAFQTTPDDTHYISEKLAKDTFDTKEDKLPDVTLPDLYLKTVEDTTTHEIKKVWGSATATASSALGDYFTSSNCDTVLKVQQHFHDPQDPTTHKYLTHWVLINHDTNYYQWWRIDVFPIFGAFSGMRIYNQLDSVEEIMDFESTHYYSGADYALLSQPNDIKQYVCTDNSGFPNPGDSDYSKIKVFKDDYVSVNMIIKNVDLDYATTNTTIAEQITLLKYVDASSNNALKLVYVGKNAKDTSAFYSVDLEAKEKELLSAAYDETSWTILSNGETDGVIQAIANIGSSGYTQGKSFVSMAVINKTNTLAAMKAKYDSGSENTNWELLNPDEVATGYLAQWLRIG